MKIFVTGGAGFIGAAMVRYLIEKTEDEVIVIDKLTYAGNLESLNKVLENPRCSIEEIDICDAEQIHDAFLHHSPDAVMHLAAESHVDRSIDGPMEFIQTNVVGTAVLLEAAYKSWANLEDKAKQSFRFHHVSTDEVYGSLGPTGLFSETTPYDPRSPYSASKASSDHLVRAWRYTYGLPTFITNCSNNYGPYQFPEKLIPTLIRNCLEGAALPIYGTGENVRDWIYVDDHVAGLDLVLRNGHPGETYNIGGGNERTNLQVAQAVCELLDELVPNSQYSPHANLIEFVTDRPGHDKRYAIDATKIKKDLGWRPRESFLSGLRKTVLWYLANADWSEHIVSGVYRGERLGLSGMK